MFYGRALRAAATLLLAGLVLSSLAGCADPDARSSAAPSGSASASESTSPSGVPTDSASPPASAPPATDLPTSPSDTVKATTKTGTVTRGGTGPCYGMTTDAGEGLALYSEAGVDLVEGSRVTVRVTPAPFEVDCGEGALMQLVEVVSG